MSGGFSHNYLISQNKPKQKKPQIKTKTKKKKKLKYFISEIVKYILKRFSSQTQAWDILEEPSLPIVFWYI